MKILLADHYGMCFGVRRAIAQAMQQAHHGSLTILGDLVHNEIVVDQLRQRGVRIATKVEAITTATVMITAHGASEWTKKRVLARGLHLVEATCPLVQLVHRSVQALVKDGFYPLIIGKPNHVEVLGIVEDLAVCQVIEDAAQISGIPYQPRFGVVAQTTQPIDKVRHLVSLIRQRFPASEIRFIDTVCQSTKQRQAAAVELAKHADVMVVIGGMHSNNTRELAATCQQYGARVYQVHTAADLHPEWFTGANLVGVTAGTSTPDTVIDDVFHWLQEMAAVTVQPMELSPGSAPQGWLRKA